MAQDGRIQRLKRRSPWERAAGRPVVAMQVSSFAGGDAEVLLQSSGGGVRLTFQAHLPLTRSSAAREALVLSLGSPLC